MEAMGSPPFETHIERPNAILFVCGMNAIRSPMAEVIAKHLLPSDIYIQSGGVRAGEADPFVGVVLDELGLELKRHTPRTMEDLEDDFFDLIITLAPEAHHAALELTRSNAVEVIYWPTPDPTVETGSRELRLEAYRGVRDRLWALIEERLGKHLRRRAQTP